MFYSYAICFGCQIALGSYNKYHCNFMKDCITVCAFNSGTSLVGGVVIFSVLGYMAHESGLSVEDVAQGGPGLAFVVYPTAVSLMPYSPFWAFAFFFMLVLVGIDSVFVGVEGKMSKIAVHEKSRTYTDIIDKTESKKSTKSTELRNRRN